MIIIENRIGLDEIVKIIPEAQKRYESLSECFGKDEITKITENLALKEPHLAIALGSINENIQLNEFMVKHVSSKGEVKKTKDRETRKKQAFQTTGLSKSARRQIARKSVKTKKANPSIERHASIKRKKAMKKRKSMGLD